MLQFIKDRITHAGIVKTLSLLLCLILISTISMGTSFAYVITGTPPVKNVFLNGLNPNGELVIRKEVAHPFGDTYTLPDDLTFHFTVNLGDAYAGETIKTTQGDETANESGVIAIEMAANDRVTIFDIDEGTSVTVAESEIGTGFTPDATSKTIEIQKYQENELVFTNTYLPEKADTSQLLVSGTKSLAGRDWQDGDSFTFELEVNEDDTWKSLGTETITCEMEKLPDPDNPGATILVPEEGFDTFDFSALIQAYAFDTAGTYSFRVSEVEGTIGGISYDEAISYFDVTIGDADMDGYLEIQSVMSASENTSVTDTAVEILFENQYAPIGSAEAVIEITKKLQDTSGQNKSPAGYTFELYAEDGTLLKTSDTTNGMGKTSIHTVYEPSDAGKIFTYTLKETNAGKTVGAFTYDDAEYLIQVSVVDNMDGTVSAVIHDAEQPEKVTDTYKATFINMYDPKDASVTLQGSKTLVGRELEAGEFAFLLYQTEKDFVIDEDAAYVECVRNDFEGVFEFVEITFAQVGTYYYVVVEDTSEKLEGVTYDDTHYLITVTVTDTEGVLTATTSIADVYGKESEISFVNSYSKEEPSEPPTPPDKPDDPVNPEDPEDPDNPEEPEQPTPNRPGGDSPDTGDNSKSMYGFGLMTLCGAAILIVLAVTGRKDDKGQAEA